LLGSTASAMGRLTQAILLSVAAVAQGFYGPRHWENVKRLNSRNFEQFVRTEVDAGNTVYIRWIHSER